MEKTKLVRTFGTALATATLSFGLFAAPAIAQVDVLDDPTVTVISNGGIIKGDARDGYTIKAEIPVSPDEIDAALPLWASASAVRYNGTQKVVQRIYAYDFDIDGDTWSETTTLTAWFQVDDEMLDGVWTIDAIGISNDGEEEAVTDLDATFTVIGNRTEVLPDVDVAPKVKSVAKSGTTLTVTADSTCDYCVAYYTLPGGDTIVRFNESNGTTFDFDNLEEGIAGKYILSKVELVGENHVLATETGDVLDNGDYTVAMTSAEAQTLFRLYNKWDGQHLYTGDPVERQTLIKAGWTDEGLAWYAPYSGRNVYRLYNKWTGEHHYTTGEAERITMISNGWTDENVGFFSAEEILQYNQKQWAGTKVFRLFNPFETVGTHHYTLSSAEYELLPVAGWNQEGIGWYSYKVWETDFNINPWYLKS